MSSIVFAFQGVTVKPGPFEFDRWAVLPYFGEGPKDGDLLSFMMERATAMLVTKGV